FAFLQVPASLYNVKSGFFASRNVAGIIGNQILKRYNITFDYQAGKSYWEPNQKFSEAVFKVSCSGLSLSLDKSKTKILLEEIYEDSPGAASDLKAGDELIEIDGVAASSASVAIFEDLLRQDGKLVKITFRRDGKQQSIQLALKAMM
ncbi:MAG: PDZ domain-containing protein, partial [Bacteroidota bacterium]